MRDTLPVIAHCLAGCRPQPFIADPAIRLTRYRNIVLARDHIHRFGWGETPIYEVQDKPGWAGPELIEPGPTFNDVPTAFLTTIQTHSVQLLHAHHGMFALEFLALRAHAGLPMIVSFYGFDASGFPRSSLANRNRLRRLFAAVSLVLAMSEDMRCDLLDCGCPEDRIVIHPPAVDTKRFTCRPAQPTNNTIDILCVSDYSPKKGVMTLVEAFAHVYHEYPQARLRLVGAPITIAQAAYAAVQRRVQELGLYDVVQFDGWCEYPAVSKLYHASDIFALPSERALDGSKEGVPAVILEAMASGLPVVSTLHAGIPDAVVDGETGWLVPERDVKRLAISLGRLISSPTLRAAMGAAGRKRVETRFDLDAQRARLEYWYDLVLRRTSSVQSKSVKEQTR